MKIDDKTYNFLFDTGWELTCVDPAILDSTNFKSLSKARVSGSSIDTQTISFGTLSSLKIGEVSFNTIGIGAKSFEVITNHHGCDPHVDGIIGANVFQHAKWQIDYEKQIIRFSNDLSKLNPSPDAKQIKLISQRIGSGYKLAKMNINGKKCKMVFDTGSSENLTLNVRSLKKFNTEDYQLIRILKGDQLKGNTPYSHYQFITNELGFKTMELANNVISLETRASQLIGNQFISNYLVTMDWEENTLYLDPVKESTEVETSMFGIILRTDYQNNKLMVSGVATCDTKAIEIPVGSEVSSINGIDISGLESDEFCEFIETKWIEFQERNTISIKFKKIDKPVLFEKQDFYKTLNG